VRNITKTIAVLSLLAPASAYPLGIGDIQMHSALNQNLDAEIALYGTAGESTTNIRVSLAPPEKFDEAGVPWNYFLTKIKFQSVTKADGSVVIKLTSKEVLNEPFLDFLIEVSWDKGNLYREFTVLVDPPAAYTRPVIPAVQQEKQYTETTKTNAFVAETAVDKYVVNKNDSLWKIAERVNTNNAVSIEQMMMAIYEANPNAFFEKNVNALKAGHTLDVPKTEAILKLSHNQAKAAFKQQHNVWKGQIAAKALARRATTETGIDTQLDLVAPDEAQITENNVLSGNETADKSFSGQSETEKLAIVSSDESVALQARMAKMEQQLTMMQKMLALKDEQIAAMQNQKQMTEVEPKTEQSKAIVKPDPEIKIKPKPKIKPKAKPIVPAEPESGFMSDTLSTI
jgi:pilus assembly protein FimV